MARLVKHERNKPYPVEAKAGETIYICACGLSKNKPYCDGSHKAAVSEQQGELYVYDEQQKAKVINHY
ncbi:MAG: CDGSH iron-sulfur domain-containing protein [Thermoplasmata archaeon]|nr:CDGSH iron-sulfur domain-containing protein [Candidatus Sysuiplasma acidicola]